MSFRKDRNTFPQEIWGEIMGYCSTGTVKILAQVSPYCYEEAQKHLWKSIRYHGRQPMEYDDDPTNSTTFVRDISLLRDILSKSDICWRSRIRFVSIVWAAENRYPVFAHYRNDQALSQATRDVHRCQVRFAHDFRQVAALISECAALKYFHMTMPCPFTVANVTSISLEPTEYDLGRYGWRRIANVFWIPTLQELRLVGRLPETPIPDDLHRSGASHITRLHLLDCSPITQRLEPMFEWLKELRQLYVEVNAELQFHGLAISVNDAVEALQPLKRSLQYLDAGFGESDYWIPEPHISNAFRSFRALRHLTLPLETFMKPGLGSIPGRQQNLSFHTWLPRTLEHLALRYDNTTPWNSDLVEDTAEESCVPDDPVHELFSRLHCLAEKKLELFPELRKLKFINGYPEETWLECEHIRMSILMIEEHGIMVEELPS